MVQPAHAAQEPANPPQPNPALADPVLANPVPTFQVPLDPPLPDAVRAMIDAAFASGQNDDVELVAKFARMTHRRMLREIDAMLAFYRSGHPPIVPADPVRNMLAAAIASGKDADVEAVAKLAMDTHPHDAGATRSSASRCHRANASRPRISGGGGERHRSGNRR